MTMTDETQKEPFEKRVFASKPYDGDLMTPKKNCGIGSMNFVFALIGKKGAISTRLATRIFLPETVERYLAGTAVGPWGVIPKTDLRIETRSDRKFEPFSSYGIFKHAPSLSGGVCEYFSSGLYNCEECRSLSDESIANVFAREGSEGVWKLLVEIYNKEFGE
jgi:hypothetical protein